MRRGLTALIAVLACLPFALVALRIPFYKTQTSKVLPIPNGDRELAWLNTTTNAATWERFVTGVQRAGIDQPEIQIDDSLAFPDDTNITPEVVIRNSNIEGALRIRWYKISNDITAADWIKKLGHQSPAPLAIIGGGSTDRATDLARAMANQTHWKGSKPLLFITMATADSVSKQNKNAVNDNDLEAGPKSISDEPLVNIYPKRTLRFCFTNKQMAEATVDFIWNQKDLRPGSNPSITNGNDVKIRPLMIYLNWEDDPFSADLGEQFSKAFYSRSMLEQEGVDIVKDNTSISFSIGQSVTANLYEKRAAKYVVSTLKSYPGRRALLVLPTVTAPARRILRAIYELDPNACNRLVVVACDGIALNAVYRDGSFAWPIDQVPFPLVLFSHANPFGWDNEKKSVPLGYELNSPTSTEDVLLFAEIARVITKCSFSNSKMATNSDEFLERIRTQEKNLFHESGDRNDGSEYIVVLKPKTANSPATLNAWQHINEWEQKRVLKLPAGSGE